MCQLNPFKYKVEYGEYSNADKVRMVQNAESIVLFNAFYYNARKILN